LKTYRAKDSDITRGWHVVDAKGEILGRLAVEIAAILRGKKKVIYSKDVDCGDFVVVKNAEKIVVTGNKFEDKLYYRHTGYIGGLKTETFKEKLEKHPTEIIRFAVKGMLPRNQLGRQMLKRLKVYAGSDHPHEAQNPIELTKVGG
jgi:large subunit ribosomal protein L13